jgi:hypothetical protein
MRRQWIVRRTTQQEPDGQRRWDRAYQEMLSWTGDGLVDEARGGAVQEPPHLEVKDESSRLCPRLDATSGASANRRTTVRSAQKPRQRAKLAGTG